MKLSRRTFVKNGIFAGVGLSLGAPSILAAKSRGPEIRVAFVGCGKQQEVLFHAMRNIPGLHYVAVCDIMNNRLGAAASRIRGVQGELPARYVDAEEMFSKEKNIDAVFVSTPDFWHAPHTIMAMDAGCHVYCEKMMSDTIEGARSIVRAAERTGKLCQIGHQRRSNPRYLFTLHQLIQKEKICGRIVNMNGQWNRAVSSSRDITVNPNILPDSDILRHYGFDTGAEGELSLEALRHRFLNWRFYKSLSGGPISDLGAHQIDTFTWFMGTAPKSVMASGGRDYFRDREHFDNVMCVFEYDTPEGSARAFYQVLTTTSAGGGYFESFMGTDGTIEISEREAFTNLWREGGSDRDWDSLVRRGLLRKLSSGVASTGEEDSIAAYESVPPDRYGLPGGITKPPHQPHIENFIAAIRGEASLNCDAHHAFEAEAPIFWVNPAAENRETIYFTDKHLKL